MVFPSMGIMFALAGTLMAKSLERPALKVIRSRIRRLLPPFWFWGFFVVVAMMIHDWMPGWQIVYWIVPLGDPPGNAWGEQAWEILWYLRTYLWFVLLSPLLLRVFRLAPVAVLVLSLAPILVVHFLWEPPDNRFGSALTDLATFLFCWILGFAHRDGVLQRLKPFAVVVLSLAAIGYGGWYAFTHQAETGTYDLDDIPLAQAFWSAGFVTLLMYAKAHFADRLRRAGPLQAPRPDRDDLQRPCRDPLPLARDRADPGRPADRPVLERAGLRDVPAAGEPVVHVRHRLDPHRRVHPALRLGGGRGGEEEAEAAALRAPVTAVLVRRSDRRTGRVLESHPARTATMGA
jgi:hypothetical protein